MGVKYYKQGVNQQAIKAKVEYKSRQEIYNKDNIR